jgi:hypothetical protein
MTETTKSSQRWLTPGVGGIGPASFLADVGQAIPTALLPNLLTATLGAPAAALGLIEGLSDGLAGAARLAAGLITSAVTGYSWSRSWLTRGCGGIQATVAWINQPVEEATSTTNP